MRGIVEDPKKLSILSINYNKRGYISDIDLEDAEGNKNKFNYDIERKEFLTDDPIFNQVVPPYSKLLEGNLESGYYIWCINGLHCKRIDISIPKSIGQLPSAKANGLRLCIHSIFLSSTKIAHKTRSLEQVLHPLPERKFRPLQTYLYNIVLN